MSTLDTIGTTRSGTPVGAPRPALVADAITMTERSIRIVLRTPAGIVSSIFVPVVLTLVMTAGFAKVVSPDASYADYFNRIQPLFVIMGIAFGSIGTGIGAHLDLNTGMDARLRTLPMAPSAPLIGRIAADAMRNLITIVVITLVGVALGFRLRAGVLPALGAVGIAVFVGIAFAWFAISVAVRAKTAEVVASMLNGIILILSFLSAGLVPVADLPGWAQPIAENSPITAAVEAMRALTQGGETAGPVLRTLVWFGAISVVASILAVRGIKRHR